MHFLCMSIHYMQERLTPTGRYHKRSLETEVRAYRASKKGLSAAEMDQFACSSQISDV